MSAFQIGESFKKVNNSCRNEKVQKRNTRSSSKNGRGPASATRVDNQGKPMGINDDYKKSWKE